MEQPKFGGKNMEDKNDRVLRDKAHEYIDSLDMPGFLGYRKNKKIIKREQELNTKTKEEEEDKKAKINPDFVETSSKEKLCSTCRKTILKGSICDNCGGFE